VTFRQLLDMMLQFMADNPRHEALHREVVLRVGVPNGDDDEDLHVGGLRSAVVDAGCTDEFALVLDADQETDEEDGDPSLGPSNDDSPAVQIEMRAAEVLGAGFGPMTAGERDGYWGHPDQEFTPSTDQLAGWLCREINEAGSWEARTAWAWDISRPIAEQLAETAALDAQADREETIAAANTTALVADLDAKGPAYDALNDAFDAEDDAAYEPGGAP
jgi:hypothetical protein